MPLETIVSSCHSDGITMLQDMLLWNPSDRPTAIQSLKYNYFKVNQKLGPQLTTNSNSQPARVQSKTLDHSFADAILGRTKLNNETNNEKIIDSPIDNMSIQQLQQQIGTHPSRSSSINTMKSGVSIKDQYLARSRYIAGQNTKNASYKNSGI